MTTTEVERSFVVVKLKYHPLKPVVSSQMAIAARTLPRPTDVPGNFIELVLAFVMM